jgi:hypothetical protein
MAVTYTFDVFTSLDGFGSFSGGKRAGYWDKQDPELLNQAASLSRLSDCAVLTWPAGPHAACPRQQRIEQDARRRCPILRSSRRAVHAPRR